MCAIAGCLAPDGGGEARIEAMLTAMRHRGPDDRGVFRDAEAGAALGHNRLALLDLGRGGRQPMQMSGSGDVLVFNGEIYNHLALRRDLEAEGRVFHTRSDTETLLHALDRWGLQALDRLAGMFAFAWWRAREGKLTLARDPLGIKPLYWTRAGNGFRFASELQGLAAGLDASPALDRRALRQFLEFGYSFELERTCLVGCHKLAPGHHLTVTADRLDPEPQLYYRPNLQPRTDREAPTALDELAATLRLVVREHLVADAPVGLLLSGGLDSSLIAALAASEAPLRTFTMGFGRSTLDERAAARRVAATIGAEHEEILIQPEEIPAAALDAARHFDDLFADWGLVSTRLLYAKARERGFKAMLVGEGADELFGGYDVFRHGASKLPQPFWLLRLYRAYSGRRWGREFPAFRTAMEGALRQTNGDRFAAIRLFETQRQLPNNYVQKVDKASMSVSLESRTPYLDRRVADLAFRLPRALLWAPGPEKLALRRIAARLPRLPAETIAAPKRGGAIAASWMDDTPAFRQFAAPRLLEGRWTRELGLRPAMQAYLIEGRAGYAFPHGLSIFRNLAWRLLALELWWEAFASPVQGRRA